MRNSAVRRSRSTRLGLTLAGLALSTLLTLGVPGFAAETAPVATSPFARQVHEHFAAWDRDSNGELSVEEIERR